MVEVVTVLAIFVIMASIASVYMSRYVNNTNLRTAARQLASDMSKMKGNAVSKTDNSYTIFFNKTTNIYAMIETIPSQPPYPLINTQTNSLTSFGQGITFDTLPGGGSTYTLNFLARGTLGSLGTITIKNSIGSSSNIVFSILGKTYVTYTMQ